LAAWQAAIGKGIVARSRVGALERLGRAPYAVWDVFGSWEKGRVRPYLQLSSLAGARYEELIGVRMPGRGIVGGVEIVFARR
jgi:iron complex outermembrane receptor protein